MRADQLPRTAAGPGDPAPPPGLVVVGRFDQPTGYGVHRPGGADSWLFTWTTAGRGHLRQGATETLASSGDLVVLAPGVAHRYGVAPGAGHWEFWWAHCTPRPAWQAWLRPYGAGDGVYVVAPRPEPARGRTETPHGRVKVAPARVPEPYERVEAAFRRMHTDARWTGTGAPPGSWAEGERVAVAHGSAARELALCALEEVVLLTAATAREQPAPPGVDARIRRAEELIVADPGAPHTVRSLAEQVALSPSRFTHLFTRQLGQPPMRALREARLRHAARLLEGTDLSVERVAAASGFASPFHFNRVFRERYGTPPGAYRMNGPMAVGADEGTAAR
ncbi:helix-turn-helix domain-containing protein [Streptomyces sp. NPDC003635]